MIRVQWHSKASPEILTTPITHHPSLPSRVPLFPHAKTEKTARQLGGLFTLGRIVPTEAKPSELSGEIVWVAQIGVKAKSRNLQTHDFSCSYKALIFPDSAPRFAFYSLYSQLLTHLPASKNTA
jgi:hypothetical protein